MSNKVKQGKNKVKKELRNLKEFHNVKRNKDEQKQFLTKTSAKVFFRKKKFKKVKKSKN